MSRLYSDTRASSDGRTGRADRPDRRKRTGHGERPAYSKKRAERRKTPAGRRDGDGSGLSGTKPGPSETAGRTAERQSLGAPGSGLEEPDFSASGVGADAQDSADARGAEDAPLLCGIKPVLELLEREPGRIDALWLRKGRRSSETARILDLCREAKIRFILCDGPTLDRLSGGERPSGGRHQGVIARLFERGFVNFSDLLLSGADAPLPLLLVLDQVRDPGNAGTLARTLHALGGAGLVVPRHNGVYLGAGARRSAAGALEQLPVAKVMNLARALDEARTSGWRVYGAAAGESGGRASVNAFAAPLRLPALLVLGSEEKGLRPRVAARCDELVRIPMLRPFDSLNVAQAGGILAACFARTLPAFAAE